MMSKKEKFLLIIFASIFSVIVLYGVATTAREMVIMLTFYSGDVKIVRNNDTLQADLDMIIRNGDEIITGSNGTAEVLFEDSTSLVLEDDTSIKIENATLGGDNSRMVAVRSFLGRVVTNVRKKVDKGYYVIKTPQAEINVKGTIFITDVNDNKETEVTVLAGQVWMKSLVDDAKEFVLSPQFQGAIKEGMTNVYVKKLSLKEVERYKKEVMSYLRDTGVLKEIDLYLREKVNMDVDTGSCIDNFINQIIKFFKRLK